MQHIALRLTFQAPIMIIDYIAIVWREPSLAGARTNPKFGGSGSSFVHIGTTRDLLISRDSQF